MYSVVFVKCSKVKINLDPYHQMGSQGVGYEGPAVSFTIRLGSLEDGWRFTGDFNLSILSPIWQVATGFCPTATAEDPEQWVATFVLSGGPTVQPIKPRRTESSVIQHILDEDDSNFAQFHSSQLLVMIPCYHQSSQLCDRKIQKVKNKLKKTHSE